jgi:hypothetical protein
MNLQEIPVAVVPTHTPRAVFVAPILREIESLLYLLNETGEGGRIDLRSLPLAPEDYRELKYRLGEGEVHADISTLGHSRVVETGIRGVWWVTHSDGAGQIVSEFIEVTRIPEILKTHPADVRVGLRDLQQLLEEPVLEVEGAADGH